MDSARPTLARRRQARRSPRPIKPLIFSILGCGVVAFCILSLLFLKPRDVLCLTDENTFCPQAWTEKTQHLKNVSFWNVGRQSSALESALTNEFPEIISLELHTTPLLQVHVRVTQAKALFPISVDETLYEVRQNGLLTRKDLDTPLIPILENTSDVQDSRLSEKWNDTTLHTLETLMRETQYFSPKLKKIILHDPMKVALYPDGHGVIFITVENPSELSRQLSTLQAFFRSSTMKDTYQELDVRFANLVVKE